MAGEIFLLSQSSRQSGPMRIDEWERYRHAFFPWRSRDARALAILNRDAVVAVAMPAATTGDADDPALGTPVSRRDHHRWRIGATVTVMSLPAAHLFRVILPVTDIARAAAFWSAVLEAPGARISPGRHYFQCGGTILACYDPVADGDAMGEGWRHHPSQYLYFAVADLDAVHARLAAAGARDLTAIERMPWGERMLYARDPFGNPISFVDATTTFTGAGPAA